MEDDIDILVKDFPNLTEQFFQSSDQVFICFSNADVVVLNNKR